MTLHKLRIKLKSEVTKTQKFFLNDAPISLADEEAVTIQEILVESKVVILKTHLNEFILLIDGK